MSIYVRQRTEAMLVGAYHLILQKIAELNDNASRGPVVAAQAEIRLLAINNRITRNRRGAARIATWFDNSQSANFLVARH